MMWKVGVAVLVMTTVLIILADGYRQRVCIGQRANMTCEGTKRIKILDAIYGVHDTQLRCVPGQRTKICWSRTKFGLVQRLCNGYPSCRILVSEKRFGHPCSTNIGSEYLDMRYICEKGPSNIISLPQQPDVFGRPDAHKYGLQFLGKIKVSETVDIPLFHIEDVQVLKNIPLSDESVAEGSLNNLINRKDIQIPRKVDDCLVGTAGTVIDNYFCICSPSGYLMMSDKVPHARTDSIQRYKIDIHMKDKRSSKHGPVIANILTKCHPIDFYYRQMRKCAKVNIHRFDAFNIEPWPNWNFYFSVESGTILSKLYIDTCRTTPVSDGNYTIHVVLGDRSVEQPFEYVRSPGANHEKRSAFWPRVFGTDFEVTFTNEITIYRSELIRITIQDERQSDIIGLSNNALTLYTTDKLHSCPPHECMSNFIRWRDAYQRLAMGGRMDCLNDDDNYYTALSFCKRSLHIDHSNMYYFGKPFHLNCHGGRPNPKKDILWYKDSQVVDGEHGARLNITGSNFIQEGFYKCEITDMEGGKSMSPKVFVRFKDVVKTVLSLEIPEEQYNIFVSRHGSNAFQQLIKSEIRCDRMDIWNEVDDNVTRTNR